MHQPPLFEDHHANEQTGVTPKLDSRYRQQERFWLDITRDDEGELADVIAELKSRRQFKRVLQSGIRLMLDLMAGKLDVLLELFPWVVEKLQTLAINRLTETIADLRADLAKAQAQVAYSAAPHANGSRVNANGNGTTPKEIDVEITQAGAGTENPFINMQIGLAQVSEKLEGIAWFSNDMLNYALLYNKFNSLFAAEARRLLNERSAQATAAAPLPAADPATTGNAKALNVPAALQDLSAPNFDDMDLL